MDVSYCRLAVGLALKKSKKQNRVFLLLLSRFCKAAGSTPALNPISIIRAY